MIRLAIETSTMTQSVALSVDGTVVATRMVHRRAGHSTTLLQSVEGVLADAEVAASDLHDILCGLGPGSFTGVRVGLALARGLGAGLNIPVGGLRSTLAFVGMVPPGTRVAVALDARKGEVYCAVYDSAPSWRCLVSEKTADPEAFFLEAAALALEGPLVLVGDGMRAFPDAARILPANVPILDALRVPLAEGLLIAAAPERIQYAGVHPLEPCYIRPSDAEKNVPLRPSPSPT